MEENFRLVLIIISAIVIAAIFLHGFWTIRKQKNPYKLNAKNAIEPTAEQNSERGYDGAGFDQDGVGKVRVVSVNNQSDEPQFSSAQPSESEIETLAEYNAETLEHYLNEPHIEDQLAPVSSNETTQNSTDIDNNLAEIKDDQQAEIKTQAPSENELAQQESATHVIDNTEELEQEKAQEQPALASEHSTNNEKNDLSAATITAEISADEVKPTIEEKYQPVYAEPVIKAKPKVEPRIEPSFSATSTKPARKNVIRKNRNNAAKDQLEINFDTEPELNTDDLPSMTATEETSVEKAPLDPEVLILSVVMPEGQFISGAALLPTLLTLGMKFGDMDIFHRHQDNAGNGKVTFSLANMMNPGVFNLDEMENMTTPGVSLFMTLPNAGDPFEVFEQMFSAAKQLAVEFKGQVLDGKRSVMTKQTEQHYISKIRDFERKKRIAR